MEYRRSSVLLASLVVLIAISNTNAQSCGNTGGNCSHLTHVRQCTADVIPSCCTRCNDLAGCSNLATNCHSDYDSSRCYEPVIFNRCCAMCTSFIKEFLGSNCMFGDKNNEVCKDSQCNTPNAVEQCCDTCFTGNRTVVPPTVAIETTTERAVETPPPDVCMDRLSNCPKDVVNVPSICYNPESRDRCCKSCKDLYTQRGSINSCPYGDRHVRCALDDFTLAMCAVQDNMFFCCDKCKDLLETTTAAPCENTGNFPCVLDKRLCYKDVSIYSEECCGTCRESIMPRLGPDCLYGDRIDTCSTDIDLDRNCTEEESSTCCATCQGKTTTTTTTTPSPSCMDTTGLCPVLVGGIARSCYFLGKSCCNSCKAFRQSRLPYECRYGDKILGCTESSCDSLADSCCGTCFKATTTMMTTTEPECTDLAANCTDGAPYFLRTNKQLCYEVVVNGRCCNSCNKLRNRGDRECPWGDKDEVCSSDIELDCENPIISEVCCGRCGDAPPTTTTMFTTSMEPLTPPPGCEDSLATCDGLTERLYNCYPDQSEFVSTGCCATCFDNRRDDLPEACAYGNRLEVCDIIANEVLCEEDENLRRDCCATCYELLHTTTSTMGVTPCPNVWKDSTCEQLIASIGNCDTIQDKCCRSCLSTTTMSSTSTVMATTTEAECANVQPDFVCELIIEGEGEDQCYTEYMEENCCNSCLDIVTTTPMTTTMVACPGDAIPNCAQLQVVLQSQDICAEDSELRSSCCEYCGDASTTTTTEMTTTSEMPPECEENIWRLAVCAATIVTSPLDEPCKESQLIADNCCAYCAMRLGTTTAMSPTTSGMPCEGDSPAFDCEALNEALDVCNDAIVAPLCCEFCAATMEPPTTTSEAPITTSSAGPCSTNTIPVESCKGFFDTQGGLSSCATDFMVERCCLFCSQVTVATTTEMVTDPSCTGDNPDFNCTALDGAFEGKLCNRGNPATNFLRLGCCQYCEEKPTTVITTTVTDAPCIDKRLPIVCISLVETMACNTDTGMLECCETCTNALATTPNVTMSTATPPTNFTTAVCIDSTGFNCTELAAIFDPCDPDNGADDLCCAFCRDRTSPAPTVTPAPCFGDIFPESACQIHAVGNPDFCDEEPLWIQNCCDFCGLPVITDSPISETTTAVVPVTTVETTVCGPKDTFGRDLCQTRIDDVPDACDDPLWLGLCCIFCEERNSGNARRKRSIDAVISREKRQADSCETLDEATCEELFYNSQRDPKYAFCVEEGVTIPCCEYCTRAPDVQTAGCTDQLSRKDCLDTIDAEGMDQCQQEPLSSLCCLTCVIATLRTPVDPLPITTPAMTSKIPVTLPTTIVIPTQAPIECVQDFIPSTCTQLLKTMPCTDSLIITKCCDFACPPTPTAKTTAATTTTETTTFAPDKAPSCGSSNNARLSTCNLLASNSPSGCYERTIYTDCCQTCTDLYYERKANGYNMEMCSYGNRINECLPSADCTDPEIARDCCDICYPKEDITPRPVVSSLLYDYVVVFAVYSPCVQAYSQQDSEIFVEFSKFVRAAAQTIFSVLPGPQTYTVDSISCDVADDTSPLIVKVSISTSPTHTFSELHSMFSAEIEDGIVGLLSINMSLSRFVHSELYNSQCSEDTVNNCEVFASTPESECYHEDPFSSTSVFGRCCVSCNAMALTLYMDRKYIPVGCAYGDKASECTADMNCETTEAQTQCCYTCAREPEEYITPTPTSTTVTTTVKITTEITTEIPTSTQPTTVTTPEPCGGDTSDKCDTLTELSVSCYNKALVYTGCCQSCTDLVRWDLPDTCPWGDRESWCSGISDDQCSNSVIFGLCCDRCGPHLTTTETPTTTTRVPTTTAPCVDSRDNCPELTALLPSCYAWGDECCESCKPRIKDHLDSVCRYGDKELYCSGLERDECLDDQFITDCCELCGPLPPTTSTSTEKPSTSSAEPPMSTPEPVCIDLHSICSLSPELCYDADYRGECCDSCSNLIDPEAPNDCRYGDHAKYCETASRERCVTEPRVFTDCCKTCEGLVAPPGVCVDLGSNCDVLTEGSGCYSDLVYSQCCDTCEKKARDNLGPTCRWGNHKGFCSSFEKSECETIDTLSQDCCALCTELVSTTTEAITTAEPQCVDLPSVNCTQDTAEPSYCYDEGVERDCCASCRKHRNEEKPDCIYGDKEDYCGYFLLEKDTICQSSVFSTGCCQFCVPDTTTAATTATPCKDTLSCTDHTSFCYNSIYEEDCCATCGDIYNPDAPAGCGFGDKATYCEEFVSAQTCATEEEVRKECCKTCPDLLRTSSTSTKEPTTVPTTTRTTVTPGPSTSTPLCTDDDDSCKSIAAADCYSQTTRSSCCSSCASFELNDEMCRYGDKDNEFCEPTIDCSISVIKDLCCTTCADYVIPDVIEAMYHLTIRVVSVECTAGLKDKLGDTYRVFKFQIEQAVGDILNTIPGEHEAALIDVNCGSVVAILELRSRGFYDLEELERIILSQLDDGQLGNLAVTRDGSFLTALSFESPNCMNGDFSLNCLISHVLTKPSNCYEVSVRVQCCRSCSSLFYSRLASGVEIDSCPYGDRDAECYTNNEMDCSTAEARDRCCDTCAGVTTAPPPTTESSTSTTAMSTTERCEDENINLCVQGVQNSVSYCYVNEAECCTTCTSHKRDDLSEECAWGNKREYCNSYDVSECTTADINSTCCELCGGYNVHPTARPCAGDNAPDAECSVAIRNPSFCYGNDFYSSCCQTCTNLMMDYLPRGCQWGDKADFCDTSATICNAHGDDVCCATCCTDCTPPTTTSTTPEATTIISTSVTPTSRPRPPGCAGDDPGTQCGSLIENPVNCYQSGIASLCCESCYYVRRIDLPLTCPYGDKVGTCGAITWDECSDVNHEAKDICCGTCFNLLDITCDISAETDTSNCMQTVARAGSCYSQDVLNKCCLSCKTQVDYSLPSECRFGDKATWCSNDITDSNRDTVCTTKATQSACCETCRDYIGLTTPEPTTVTVITTMPATTRLPPIVECPEGDTSDDCESLTSGTGACYDTDISTVCCRTCYEEWRGDLPTTCRYGDKSKYCTTVDENDIDTEWCIENAETCCARCVGYLTTTLPTTTLPAECPQGNVYSDCSARVQDASDCYSPIREAGCCVECTRELRSDAPHNCRYGDKAAFCQDLNLDECPNNAETCCDKCAAYLTTPTAAPTTISSATTAKPSTKLPTTTVDTINRESPLIGRGLFDRPAPPGNMTLYQVLLTKDEQCIEAITDVTSREFEEKENIICTDLSRKFWSMVNCYVQEILACSSEISQDYDVMVLVDRRMNYDRVEDVTASQLKEELMAGQPRSRRSILYSEISVKDVNECEVIPPLIKDKCDSQATCRNTEGLYSCECEDRLVGDGFECRHEIDPLIGRESFVRNAPPTYPLYEIELDLQSTAGQDHGCFDGMNKEKSSAFVNMEATICSEMGVAMKSLYACFVQDFNCDVHFKAKIYVLIDIYKNYKDSETSTSLLKAELDDYNGILTSRLIRDVDECHTDIDVIMHQCAPEASCVNSVGLYSCLCGDNLAGDGFTCEDGTAGRFASPAPSPSGLADWAIALIVVGAVILLVALLVGLVYCCRYCRNKNNGGGHEPLDSGEVTPPRTGGSLPPLYNSMRSTKAPHSEIGSYFYAQQERELPGYAMKTYNVRDGEIDPTVYTFD